MGDVSVRFSVGGPFRCWAVGNPRERWPREGDFCRWLAGSQAMLAECIGVPGLVVTGREVAVGEQVLSFDRLGRQRRDGGVRPARNRRGVAPASYEAGCVERMRTAAWIVLALLR